MQFLHRFTFEKLECTVNIRNLQSEQYAVEGIPYTRIQESHRGVTPSRPVPDNGVIFRNMYEQLLELTHIKLQISIGKEYILHSGRLKTRAKRRSVPLIRRVIH